MQNNSARNAQFYHASKTRRGARDETLAGCLAAIGAVLIACSAWALLRWSLPEQHLLINQGGCHTPVTVSARPATGIRSRRWSSSMALPPIPPDDVPGNGIRRVGWCVYLPTCPAWQEHRSFHICASCNRRRFNCRIPRRSGQINRRKTILAGHSLGARSRSAWRTALRAGNSSRSRRRPTSPPRRMPSNLLVVSAGFDDRHRSMRRWR